MADKLCVRVNFENRLYSFDFPENANLYDLKQAIKTSSGIEPAHQNLIGEFPISELTDDVPLMALGVSPMEFLLFSTQPASASPAPVAERPQPNSSKSSATPAAKNAPKSTPTPPKNQQGPGLLRPNDLTIFLDKCTTDSEVFTSIYESKYGDVHPHFVGSTFSDVINAAKSEKKLVLVSVHGGSVNDYDFRSLVLSRPELSQYLESEPIIFWVGETTPVIEKSFYELFRFNISYPFLALLGHSEGSMVVVDFINNMMMAHELISRLKRSLENHKQTIAKQIAKEKENEALRKMRAEQDQAYRDSELEDFAKERLKEREKEQKEKQHQKEKRSVSSARSKALEAFKSMTPEPAQGTPGALKVCIRLVDGTRTERRFLSSDLFLAVLNFVAGTVATKLDDTTFLDENSPPLPVDTTTTQQANVIPWDIANYDLVMNYPKKTFNNSNAQETLANLQISSQTMLFMQHK